MRILQGMSGHTRKDMIVQWNNTCQDYEFTTQERVGKTLITEKMIESCLTCEESNRNPGKKS